MLERAVPLTAIDTCTAGKISARWPCRTEAALAPGPYGRALSTVFTMYSRPFMQTSVAHTNERVPQTSGKHALLAFAERAVEADFWKPSSSKAYS